MDTISYLLELIETRKNVGITDFGTLYVKKMPGRYDAEVHAFLPPKHKIAFTSEVINEEDLVNFISEKRNISAESAAHDIAQFVTHIKTELASHQLADISPLGAFKIINDQIEFESSEKFQIGSDFYGLPSIPVVVNNPTIEEVHSPITAPSANDEQVTPPPPPPLTDPVWRPTVNDRYEYDASDDDEEENKGSGKRIFFKTLLILLVIAVAAAAVYFFYPNLLNNLVQKHPDQQIESASAIIPDTSSTQKPDSAFADSIEKTIKLTEPAKDTVIKDSIITSVTYEVIGSAMKSKKKVQEVIGNFIRRGIKAKAIDALPGRSIKISLGTFTDYNLAKKHQDSLRIKLKNPQIYIETIKPKN